MIRPAATLRHGRDPNGPRWSDYDDTPEIPVDDPRSLPTAPLRRMLDAMDADALPPRTHALSMGPALAERAARGRAWVAQQAVEARLFETEGWHVAALFSMTLPDAAQRCVDTARLYEAAGYEVIQKNAIGDHTTMRIIIRSLPREDGESEGHAIAAMDAAERWADVGGVTT